MTISVLISTYGGDGWKNMALTRAYPSAHREQPDEIIVHHDPDGLISTSRNAAVSQATSEWLLFLDADDELGAGYVRAMKRMIERCAANPRVLYTPAVMYVRQGRRQRPRFWPEVNLATGNWLVIGTVLHRSLFDEVGGFEDWPHGIEDFNLWSKCAKAGAQVIKVPKAVYVAHTNRDSQHHHLMRDKSRHEQWRLKAVASVHPELAE